MTCDARAGSRTSARKRRRSERAVRAACRQNAWPGCSWPRWVACAWIDPTRGHGLTGQAAVCLLAGHDLDHALSAGRLDASGPQHLSHTSCSPSASASSAGSKAGEAWRGGSAHRQSWKLTGSMSGSSQRRRRGWPRSRASRRRPARRPRRSRRMPRPRARRHCLGSASTLRSRFAHGLDGLAHWIGSLTPDSLTQKLTFFLKYLTLTRRMLCQSP